MSVKLLYIDKNYDKIIERVAKTSTSREISNKEEDSILFTKRMVKRNHLSVGRFAHATFEITCSLVASHQICRHPFLSIIQKSLRYTKFYNNDEFIMPDDIRNNSTAKVYFKNILEKNKEAYQELLDMGIKQESARYVLPVATETKMSIQSNFQGWLDVCSLRTQKDVQLETREIFQEIFNILCKEAPVFFEYFQRKDKVCRRKIFEKEENEV